MRRRLRIGIVSVAAAGSLIYAAAAVETAYRCSSVRGAAVAGGRRRHAGARPWSGQCLLPLGRLSVLRTDRVARVRLERARASRRRQLSSRLPQRLDWPPAGMRRLLQGGRHVVSAIASSGLASGVGTLAPGTAVGTIGAAIGGTALATAAAGVTAAVGLGTFAGWTAGDVAANAVCASMCQQ